MPGKVHYMWMLEPLDPAPKGSWPTSETVPQFTQRISNQKSEKASINLDNYDLLDRPGPFTSHKSVVSPPAAFSYEHLPLPPSHHSTRTMESQSIPYHDTRPVAPNPGSLVGCNVDTNDRRLDNNKSIYFQACRLCSGKYAYQLRPGKVVNIIAGIPSVTEYKAMSFVWGDTIPTDTYCQRCQKTTVIPLASTAKFHNLMSLAMPNSTIWLDILSIDQSSKEDVSSRISMMGTIYGNANSVSVLLPGSDQVAYNLLASVVFAATVLLKHAKNFRTNREHVFGSFVEGLNLGYLARLFFANLDTFEQALPSWAYWQRAWTFQEWSLASEIEIAVENGMKYQPLPRVKSTIFRAVVMLANYKLQNGQYSKIQLGFSRGEIARRFDTIKRLFPYEDYLCSYEETNDTTAAYQTVLPSAMGTDQLLGIRLQPRQLGTTRSQFAKTYQDFELDKLVSIQVDPNSIKSDKTRSETASRLYGWNIYTCQVGTGPCMRPFQRKSWENSRENILDTRPDARFRARLSIMLTAFGTSKRKARFDADLIACWASMCDISYEYNKDDTFAQALQKALRVLRERGIKIYNFLVNTDGASLEVDLHFLQYASPHPQCNASNRQYLPGAPAFNGRADTAIHLYYSLNQPTTRALLTGPRLHLRKLTKRSAKVVDLVELTNLKSALYSFYRPIRELSDDPSDNIFLDMDIRQDKIKDLFVTDVIFEIQKVLENTSREKLQASRLALIQLEFISGFPDPRAAIYSAWAICPANTVKSELFVAREELNGTLVLATETRGRANVVAYLTTTDQQSGSYLVETNEEGMVYMISTTTGRSDILHTGYNSGAKAMRGKFDLESRRIVVGGSWADFN